MSESSNQLACNECGSFNLWAWYPRPERQTIEVVADGEGGVKYDYTGITSSGEEAGEDDEFWCFDCYAAADTIEELVGFPPKPKPVTLNEEVADILSHARTALDDPGGLPPYAAQRVAELDEEVEEELHIYGSIQGPSPWERYAIECLDRAIRRLLPEQNEANESAIETEGGPPHV